MESARESALYSASSHVRFSLAMIAPSSFEQLLMLSVEPLTGAKQVTLAVNQEEYEPLTVALYINTDLNSPVLYSRWKLSEEERQALIDGQDIFVGQVTYGQPLQPVSIQVGNGGLEAGNTYENILAIVDA
jgi:hypothetical protein